MVTPRSLVNNVMVAGAATVYYTAPTGVRTFLKKLTFCNTTATAAWISVFIVPLGGSPTATNTLVYQLAMPAAPSPTLDIYQALNVVLEPGMSLQLQASAAALLSALCSGLEVSG